jgi:hypothetical protein
MLFETDELACAGGTSVMNVMEWWRAPKFASVGSDELREESSKAGVCAPPRSLIYTITINHHGR